MTDDEFTREVREFAVQIMECAADDPVARLGILHAATQMIVAFAIEEQDPLKTIADLTGDIHSEALAMAGLVLTSREISSETKCTIPMRMPIKWRYL